VVTDTRKVLYTAATDEDDAVLLQIVADAGDVAGGLNPVGETDPGYFTESGVGLFGGGCSDGSTYTALLGRILLNGRALFGVPSSQQRGGSRLLFDRLPSLADELVKGRHILHLLIKIFANGGKPPVLPLFAAAGDGKTTPATK
jgi:hypothetical protein